MNTTHNPPRGARRGPTALLLVSAIGGLVAPHGAEAQDAYSLEGLVITASPTPLLERSVASHVTILDAALLAEHGDRSLGDVLRDVAGVEVARNGSFGAATSVFLRGGESDYTLVLVDGVQVNQAGGGFDFSTLTTDNVERVEIVRGPASALYGSDAVTGVIQIVTKTGRGVPHGNASAIVGTYGRRDWSGDLSGGNDRAGYSMALSRQGGDGILAFNNEHAATVFSGRVRFLPDERTEVGLAVRWTEQEYHFPTDGSGAVVDRNAYTFNDATLVQATVSRALSGLVTLEGRVGVSDIDGGTDDQQDGPADSLGYYGFTSLDRFRRATGEVRVHVDFDDAVLTGGFEAEREGQRSFTDSQSEFGPSSDRSRSERTNRAGFLHASATTGPFALTVGGRLEDNQRFGRFATWQAGLTWRAAGPGTILRGSAGTAIKEPTFFENFATGFARGNPDLDPERSRSWEVGIEQPLVAHHVDVRATYFDQRFEDLIQYTFAPPAPSDPNYFNVAEAKSRGVEVDLTARVAVLSLGVAGTWLDTEVLDSGFDDGPGATFVEGESLLRRPERTVSLRASTPIGDAGRADARLTVVGARSDRDFTTFPATPVVLPRYELLSVGGEWTFAGTGSIPALTATLRADNVLDAAYDEVLGYRAPGRTLYVGARVALGGPPR